MGLLTGKSGGLGVLFFQDKKCLVEGVFDVTAYGMEKAFQEHDLDYDHECIIRREILPGGKSRAFVNDTPVTLQCLKELTMPLIDIHSQYLALQALFRCLPVEIDRCIRQQLEATQTIWQGVPAVERSSAGFGRC